MATNNQDEPVPPAPIDPETSSVCDLCQNPVSTSMDEHYLTDHGSLVHYCNSFIDKSAAILARSPSATVTQQLGSYVISQLAKMDKGEKAFRGVLEAQEQMSAILRSVPAFQKDKLFTFGSTLAYGSWDEMADIDMTLVEEWQFSGESQQCLDHDKEVQKVMKVVRALRDAGFRYEDLEPVRHTRVPIVKHKSSSPKSHSCLQSRQLRVTLSGVLTAEEATQVSNDLNIEGISCAISRNRVVCVLTCSTDTQATIYRSDYSKFPLPKGKRIANIHWSGRQRPISYTIDFDVSFRPFGIRNSWLLRQYLSQSHESRCGSMLVKMWSKCCGINNSKKGYFTTYAINILWIYYLLRKEVLKFIDPASITPEVWTQTPHYLPLVPPQSSETLERGIGDLIVGFFKFYAFEFNWKDSVVSINRSTETQKESLGWIESKEVKTGVFRDRVWYRVAVEDPYEHNLNLGRHISPVKFHKVLAEFIAGFSNVSRGLAGDLLVDMSCEKSADECRRVVVRSMLCIDTLPLDKIVDDLRRKCPSSLAAYEAHNTTTSLFVRECKYTLLSANGSIAVTNPLAEEEVGIETILEDIENFSAKDAEIGYKECDARRLNLLQRILYIDNLTMRLFLSTGTRDRFSRHFKAAQRHLISTQQVTIKAVLDSAVSLEESFLRRVIEVEKMGTIDSNGNIKSLIFDSSTKMDSANCVSGTCNQCLQGNRLVYGSTNRSQDNGMYCIECWKKYDDKER